jgi:outer membrane protein assembly factor BamD (BamD/ComL family)
MVIKNSLFLGLVIFWVFTSCAPENNGFAGRLFHNTTSHYNAYFLSRERMKETEAKMFAARKDDYSRILDPLVPLDSTSALSYKADMDYVLKKSSIGIQFHKYSHWTDDHYLLVGKARLYQFDLRNASETFKYVNAQSPDNTTRQKAMLGLMQVFLWQKEYEKSRATIGYIRKEKLSRDNAARFYLLRGQLYKELEDYTRAAAALKLALPLMKRSEVKARTCFVAGQLYQAQGKNFQAYQYYKKVLTYTPQFELDFNARLNLIANWQIKKNKDEKKQLVLLQKMLRDEKNKEYQDQIYYSMALFEYNRKNYPKALRYLQQSIQVSDKNKTQKALSFLKTGEIYYENLRQYELASAYYDSTIQLLPKDFKHYDLYSKRQKILGAFAKHLVTVKTEDSLQQLARMDKQELDALLEKRIEKEEAQQAKEARKRQQQEETAENQSTLAFASQGQNLSQGNPDNTGTWYFYNALALSQGQTEFTRRWGKRPEEDNWRRAQKGVQVPLTQVQDTSSKPGINENIARQTDAQKAKMETELRKKNRKQELLSTLPLSAEALNASDKKIEKSLFQLGKIYDLDLEEDTNAVKTYQNLLQRFPDTEYEPEVLYALCLLYKNLGNEAAFLKAREHLQTQYPASDFAKLIDNPNYTQEGNVTDKQVEERYTQAYELYQAAQYDQASSLIRATLQQFPDSRFVSQFRLLDVYIVAKTQELPNYKLALKQFISDFPKSPYVSHAQKLLDASTGLDNRK